MISVDQQLGRRGAGGDAERGDAVELLPGDLGGPLHQQRLGAAGALRHLHQPQRVGAVGRADHDQRSQRAAIAFTASWRLVVA